MDELSQSGQEGRISINVCNTNFFEGYISTVLSGEANNNGKEALKGISAQNTCMASGNVFTYPLRLPELENIVKIREAFSADVFAADGAVPEPPAHARFLPVPPGIQTLCGIYDNVSENAEIPGTNLHKAAWAESLSGVKMPDAASVIVECCKTMADGISSISNLRKCHTKAIWIYWQV